MRKREKELSNQDFEQQRGRRLEAMHLQEIEGNPLDDEDIAMFEMFERQKWTPEQRHAFLLKWAQDIAVREA